MGAAVLAAVLPQTGRAELGNAGHVDEQIDREITVFSSGELVADVACNTEFVAVAVLTITAEQFAEIVEQTPLRGIPDDIGGRIEARTIGLHHAERYGVGRGIEVGTFPNNLDVFHAPTIARSALPK